MAKKKKVVVDEFEGCSEYGFIAKDEFGNMLVLKSNSGRDMGKYLKYASSLDRPILFSIEGEMFDSYKFKVFAMTREEARNFVREMNRMLDHLDEKE